MMSIRRPLSHPGGSERQNKRTGGAPPRTTDLTRTGPTSWPPRHDRSLTKTISRRWDSRETPSTRRPSPHSSEEHPERRSLTEPESLDQSEELTEPNANEAGHLEQDGERRRQTALLRTKYLLRTSIQL